MNFKVVKSMSFENEEGVFYLVIDNWNDWFKYNTLYDLKYIDKNSEEHYIGAVKIGQFSKKFTDYDRPDLPKKFNTLSDDFFSLGQDASYYENLRILGNDLNVKVLKQLNDCAYNLDIFQSTLELVVMQDSLLREVSKLSVKGQFNRIARGGDKLKDYSFSFTLTDESKKRNKKLKLEFDITPESKPPTNVHVIIGRNGVGKTRLLNGMINTILDSEEADVSGTFDSEDFVGDTLFSKLVAVTFSAFDQNFPIEKPDEYEGETGYSYIGLKKQIEVDDELEDDVSVVIVNKSNEDLYDDFKDSFESIKNSKAKIELWKRAINKLDNDPLFKEIGLIELITKRGSRTRKFFNKLSSGHKVVVLSITRLVENVEERTIVLLDEPEAHLHPPLLSAYIRSISDLLVYRNGVALIATHSPVVLQEIPKSCVWKLTRRGVNAKAERLSRETFGENLGILSREVFGYEVTNAGFHELLKHEVSNGLDFEEVIEEFNHELGNEALAIIRGLCNRRD